MSTLVVGGAGYIGCHIVKRLTEQGEEVVVFDNLNKGHLESIPGVKLVRGDLLNRTSLDKLFFENKIEKVFHFAALCYVGESVTSPADYWRNNVTGTLNLLDAMIKANILRIVFSSTAAVYGDPDTIPIKEDHRLRPINPYGNSKLAVEKILQDYSNAYNIRFAALRYFNAAGAALDGSIGEDHMPETHLIPIILECALGKRKEVLIFGTDYDTPDGTCVRDYVHVDDLADAHVLACEKTASENIIANLGTGKSYSVREVIEAARQVTGCEIPAVESPRRPGDPAELVASNELARQELGWEPKHSSIEEILETAWKWHQAHPEGYK